MVLCCVGYEEVLSGAGGDQLHVMVADVIKSFDTVDRSILDCALGRLGLPVLLRKGIFSFHIVRFGFGLSLLLVLESLGWYSSRLSAEYGIYCCPVCPVVSSS